MPHESRYFIEYRICGKFRLELLSIQKDLLSRFPDFNLYDQAILHITLVPPITELNTHKEFILESVRAELKNSKILEFKVKEYNFFNNEDNKPIFVTIKFDDDFEKVRHKLIKKLEKNAEISNVYEKKEGFNAHISLGFTEKKRSAKEVVEFLNKNYPFEKRQVFDRITILNGNRLLWDYDIFNKRTLGRSDALKHSKRLENIQRIIDLKNMNEHQKLDAKIVKYNAMEWKLREDELWRKYLSRELNEEEIIELRGLNAEVGKDDWIEDRERQETINFFEKHKTKIRTKTKAKQVTFWKKIKNLLNIR